MSRKFLIGASVIAFILIASASSAYFQRTPAPPQSAEKAHWAERIRSVGGDAAYEEFARSMETLPIQEHHLHAHQFGSALYETAGIDGIGVCDERFTQGCMHAFMGEALREFGIGYAPELVAACAKNNPAHAYICAHGIGHGAVSFFGYDEDSLMKALNVCASGPSDPLNGCYTGVFMEYNHRNILTLDDSPRPYEGDWYKPCGDFEGNEALFCYFALPRWWHQLGMHAQTPVPDILAKVADRCEALPEPHRDTCISGMGPLMSVDARFDAAKTRDFCRAYLKEKRDQVLCLAQAANSFFLENSPDALAVCEGLSGISSEYCRGWGSDAVLRGSIQSLVLPRKL